MTKREVVILILALAIGLAVGAAGIKIQLMDSALRNQAARLSTLEGTTAQIVTFINGVQAQAQGAGQPQGQETQP